MTPPRSFSPSQHSRLLIALLILITIAAGLWTRSRYFPLPPFYAKYGGDALWAIVAYAVGIGVATLLKFLWIRLSQRGASSGQRSLVDPHKTLAFCSPP